MKTFIRTITLFISSEQTKDKWRNIMYCLVIRDRNVLNIAEQVSLLGTLLKRGKRESRIRRSQIHKIERKRVYEGARGKVEEGFPSLFPRAL